MGNAKPKLNYRLIDPGPLSFPNTRFSTPTAGVGIGYTGPPPNTPFSNPPTDNYLNPSGFGLMRNDDEGLGHFKAWRRNPDNTRRRHNSLDILSEIGQPIYAPFDGRAGVADHEEYEGVDMGGKKHFGRILYITPTNEIANAKGKIRVKKGDVIGYAQDVFPIYKKKKMKNHIHMELYRYPNIKKGISWGPIDPVPLVELGVKKNE
ncbi:MAG: hypothetical protein JRD68_00570 [Deltaproteobacteria bacterium]|nr:hypothetical protein [Deltaproteobacteria bacterium]